VVEWEYLWEARLLSKGYVMRIDAVTDFASVNRRSGMMVGEKRKRLMARREKGSSMAV